MTWALGGILTSVMHVLLMNMENLNYVDDCTDEGWALSVVVVVVDWIDLFEE